MIFCTWKRIVKFGDHYKDTSMRNKPIGKSQMIEDPRYPSDGARSRCDTSSYDLQQTQGLTMAFTTTSNGYDLEGIKAAKIAAGPNGDVNKEDFGIRNRKLADTIDICRWYLHAMQLAGMPRINKDRIIQTQQPGFKASTIGHSMPVDGLRNVGATLLHEVRYIRLDNKAQ